MYPDRIRLLLQELFREQDLPLEAKFPVSTVMNLTKVRLSGQNRQQEKKWKKEQQSIMS